MYLCFKVLVWRELKKDLNTDGVVEEKDSKVVGVNDWLKPYISAIPLYLHKADIITARQHFLGQIV